MYYNVYKITYDFISLLNYIILFIVLQLIMSEILTALCSAMLRERYGEIVEKVGTFLMKTVSPCSFHMIVKKVALPIETVRVLLIKIYSNDSDDL